MIVDAHAHFVAPGIFARLKSQKNLFPSVQLLEEGKGFRMSFAGRDPTRIIPARLYDPEHRKRWLDQQRIDHQVVACWLDLFGYELPADEAADWCRFLNEELLNFARSHGFLTPLACVPLQSGSHAATVLQEAVAAGFRGIMIGTQPKGVGGNLDDPGLDPFWKKASDAELPVFLHPMFACPDERLSDYDLVNSVGRVSDTSAAAGRLLCSGHLQRFPGIKLILSHGGGALPFILGRLKRTYERNDRKFADPAEGFRRLYFDTVLYDPQAVRFLRDVAGADRLMLGSDSPFLEGDPLPYVTEAQLAPAARDAVLGGNAARLFRIAS